MLHEHLVQARVSPSSVPSVGTSPVAPPPPSGPTSLPSPRAPGAGQRWRQVPPRRPGPAGRALAATAASSPPASLSTVYLTLQPSHDLAVASAGQVTSSGAVTSAVGAVVPLLSPPLSSALSVNSARPLQRFNSQMTEAAMGYNSRPKPAGLLASHVYRGA